MSTSAVEVHPLAQSVEFTDDDLVVSLVDGRKVVGISQRRSRDVARFQCLVHRVWDPQPLLDLLHLSPDDRIRGQAELRDAAAGPGVPLDDLEAAFIAELDSGTRKPVTDGAVPPVRPA